MTAILGISAFYHDSAAAIIVDGEIVAAAQEERFTRNKHDHQFPYAAIQYCLEHCNLEGEDLDYVGFYDKPFLKFDRLLETYLAYAPSGFRSFKRAMPLWMRQKLHLPRIMRRSLGGKYQRRFVFPEHHESHAASAFFPSPFEEAAILTVDGVGEWATQSLGVGRENGIRLIKELRFPHSLGLLYSAFTYFLGFRVNSGEYKMMGLAPFGEPKYADRILDHLIDLREDGSFRLDMSYFQYCQGLKMTSRKLDSFFGRPPRRPESEITAQDMDIAASIQKVTEEVMLKLVRHAHEVTGLPNLCLAGGVALNCVANGRVLREGPFEKLWIQPAAGDAGGALGVALLIWHQLLDNPRFVDGTDSQLGSFLGPQFSNHEIHRYLDSMGAKYTLYESEERLLDTVVEGLEQGLVVGWFQGRMEFGPRSLGARSIIGDPRRRDMQSKMNLKIKFRESFRPFAPSVLQGRARDFFKIESTQESPYMLLVTDVAQDTRLDLTEADMELRGFKSLNTLRSKIPAVTHVDLSARLHTVDADRNPKFYNLLNRFDARTKCPTLINTSFNVRGEPIVCSPEDAYRCFMATDMDILVLEDNILLKKEQPKHLVIEQSEHLEAFELD